MGNSLDISCRENQNTHFMFNNSPSPPENRAVYYIMSKNVETEGATNDVTIWRIHVACWISKAAFTYAHAYAHASGCLHARTHAHAYTHTNK